MQLIRVIHLVDTDGVFIPSDKVVFGSSESIRYFDDRIETKTPDKIVDRNTRKAQVLRRLYSTIAVGKIPYSIYFIK